jgi:hypothetical protein
MMLRQIAENLFAEFLFAEKYCPNLFVQFVEFPQFVQFAEFVKFAELQIL